MVELFTLSNLAAWNLQIALLIAIGAILPRVLRIEAPSIRHAFWRTLLALCLLLPLLQTWRVLDTAPLVLTSDAVPLLGTHPNANVSSLNVPGGRSLAADFWSTLRTSWPTSIATVLLAGIAIRGAWLIAGMIRLRRMRTIGAVVPTSADDIYDEVSALVQTGAVLRRVKGLGQPVTFGVWKPTVLLPESFDTLSPGVRRAVLAHELWHVRRRDWAWLVGEEMLRAVFWFNPAMSWLISQVQRSREEVVDELTIQLTNARRTYLETLLCFADEASMYPAAPIASRRHLLQRMLLISKEARMSPRRIVGASMVTMLAIIGTMAYGASAFPLDAPARTIEAPPPQAAAPPPPPRDRRPTEAAPETTRERELKQQLDGSKPGPYLELAKLQEQRRAYGAASTTLESAQLAFAKNISVLTSIGTVYLRFGQFDKALSLFEMAAAVDASNAEGYQVIAAAYFEKANKDVALTAAEKIAYLQRGIEATDRALAIDPNYVDSLIYKNLLLRTWANIEPSRATELIGEADALRSRAMKLRTGTTQFTAKPSNQRQGDYPPPPPPPPPPPDDSDWPDAVRVGGGIKPPVKVKDVKPAYPPIAQESRVQGVVIMQITIDPLGRVARAHVLRGQPLLDQAALEAVKEWEFKPTEVNGAAVPVIMTVTINFKLDDPS